jgi:serine/threonine-protein kinase RsbW
MNTSSNEGEPEVVRAQTRITSDLSQLAAARAFVRDFCVRAAQGEPDEDGIAQLELAVTEAVSNIIRHAYGGQADKSIQIEAKATGEGIAIRLHHEGLAFDPDEAAAPIFDGSREGGLGVYIIENTVDAVQYAQDRNDRNTIHLYKRMRTQDAQ